MTPDGLWYITSTVGGGFFAGIVTGWALKKVIKIIALIVGVFLGVLVYLQSQTIIDVNWNKLQSVSETSLLTIGNSITNAVDISMFMENVEIPLTGSLSAGFAIGFMKG